MVSVQNQLFSCKIILCDCYNLWKTLIIHLSLNYSFLFSEPFKLCTPFNGGKEEDVANFIGTLVGIAMGAVQYDFNAKAHGLLDITEVCNTMVNEEHGNNPLDRLAKLNEM